MKSSAELKQEYDLLLLQMALAADLEEDSEQIFSEVEARTASGDTAEVDEFFERTERNTRALINREVRKQRLLDFSKNTLPKVGRFAAMFLLVAFVGLTTAIAAIRPVRVRVLELLVRMDNPEYAELSLVEKENASFDVPSEWGGGFYPTYIPEGFSLARIEDLGVEHHVEYTDNRDARLTISEAGIDTYTLIDTEDARVHTIAVNGNFGVMSVKETQIIVAWAFQDKYFVIMGNLDEDTIMRVAESILRIF